jgi:hypothetical protein
MVSVQGWSTSTPVQYAQWEKVILQRKYFVLNQEEMEAEEEADQI